MKIYLDDVRSAPKGYELARNFAEFKNLIKQAQDESLEIESMSFDNDLGQNEIEGYEVMKWLAAHHPEYLTASTEIKIHTSNPNARDNMEAFVEHCRRHPREIQEAIGKSSPFENIK